MSFYYSNFELMVEWREVVDNFDETIDFAAWSFRPPLRVVLFERILAVRFLTEP